MRSRPLPSSSTTCSRRVHPVTLDPDVIRSRCTRSRSLSSGSVSGNATTKPRKHEEKREEEYVFFVLFVDFRVFVVAFRQEQCLRKCDHETTKARRKTRRRICLFRAL